jgi:hypothetical protein
MLTNKVAHCPQGEWLVYASDLHLVWVNHFANERRSMKWVIAEGHFNAVGAWEIGK